jgi:ABC-type dipeptide/oligopeptide/nickel transport system permease component
MSAYLLRRVLQMIPTLLGVVLLVFFLFTYVGGDPATILAGKIPSAARTVAAQSAAPLSRRTKTRKRPSGGSIAACSRQPSASCSRIDSDAPRALS